eukprot:TRINITY_DN4189_c0_g1_i3.p1 TRINITY_DN4189_c0_g1~~TRINITY_DN4189_c0_g1_i3.p1  ORF type:complete len:537 (-),score=132.40 TRINITY_DN4189_c0_g1_i3:218-1828(-)
MLNADWPDRTEEEPCLILCEDEGAVGNATSLVCDECNVCGGNNESCAGCDGVPNSGAERDVCSVCRSKAGEVVGENEAVPGDTCDVGGMSFGWHSRCTRGVVACNETRRELQCDGAVGPLPLEECGEDGAGNGVDDNCNGVVDEGCGGTTCVHPRDCDAFNSSPCAVSVCDEANLCRYDGGASVEGTPCDDGLSCTVNDACDASGGAGRPSECVGELECEEDNNVCTAPPVCNPFLARCEHANLRDGDQPLGCTDSGDAAKSNKCLVYCSCQLHSGDTSMCSCRDKLSISTLASPVSGCDDHNPCTIDSCDPEVGFCSHEPVANNTVCPGVEAPSVCHTARCIVGPAGTAGDVPSCMILPLEAVPFEDGGCNRGNECEEYTCDVGNQGTRAYCSGELLDGTPCSMPEFADGVAGVCRVWLEAEDDSTDVLVSVCDEVIPGTSAEEFSSTHTPFGERFFLTIVIVGVVFGGVILALALILAVALVLTRRRLRKKRMNRVEGNPDDGFTYNKDAVMEKQEERVMSTFGFEDDIKDEDL